MTRRDDSAARALDEHIDDLVYGTADPSMDGELTDAVELLQSDAFAVATERPDVQRMRLRVLDGAAAHDQTRRASGRARRATRSPLRARRVAVHAMVALFVCGATAAVAQTDTPPGAMIRTAARTLNLPAPAEPARPSQRDERPAAPAPSPETPLGEQVTPSNDVEAPEMPRGPDGTFAPEGQLLGPDGAPVDGPLPGESPGDVGGPRPVAKPEPPRGPLPPPTDGRQPAPIGQAPRPGAPKPTEGQRPIGEAPRPLPRPPGPAPRPGTPQPRPGGTVPAPGQPAPRPQPLPQPGGTAPAPAQPAPQPQPQPAPSS
jgi:hypothetical protein